MLNNMSKFTNALNQLILEAEFSTLPGDVPGITSAGNEPTDAIDLPPDTTEQDDIGEFNILQLAAKSMLFNPASISDTDKAKFASFAEKGVTADDKEIITGLLNSYLA